MSVIFTRKGTKSGPSSVMMRNLLSAPNTSRIIHKANHHVVIGEYGMNLVNFVNLETSENLGVGQYLSFSCDIPGA